MFAPLFNGKMETTLAKRKKADRIPGCAEGLKVNVLFQKLATKMLLWARAEIGRFILPHLHNGHEKCPNFYALEDTIQISVPGGCCSKYYCTLALIPKGSRVKVDLDMSLVLLAVVVPSFLFFSTVCLFVYFLSCNKPLLLLYWSQETWDCQNLCAEVCRNLPGQISRPFNRGINRALMSGVFMSLQLMNSDPGSHFHPVEKTGEMDEQD